MHYSISKIMEEDYDELVSQKVITLFVEQP